MGCQGSKSKQHVPDKKEEEAVETSIKMATGYTNGIVIWCYGKTEVHINEYDKQFTAEDLAVIAAKTIGITPVGLQLFALVRPDHKTWLPPCEVIKCSHDGVEELFLRMRAKPHEKNLRLIAEADSDAFTYIFLQMEDDFIHERIVKLYDAKISTEYMLGFCVIDMIRKAKETCIDVDKLCSQFSHDQFLPRKVVESFKYPWRSIRLKMNFKKQLEEMFQQKQSARAIDMRLQYVQGMYDQVPNYAVEHFLLVWVEKAADFVAVDPFHKTMPGLYYVNKQKPICTLENIMDICVSPAPSMENSDDNWLVQINRRDCQPETLVFAKKDLAMSFVSLVDMYYRMTVDYYQHLSTEVQTSFLEHINKMRCHAPVDNSWVKERLKKSPEAGSYLFKVKRHEYDTYVLFVQMDSKKGPHLFFIRQSPEDKKYRLSFEENGSPNPCFPEDGCDNILDLLSKVKAENPRGIKLLEPIRPTKAGMNDSGVLLCRAPDPIATEDEEEESTLSVSLADTDPVVLIRADKLKVDDKIGEGPFTYISKGRWTSATYINKPVAVKTLKPQYTHLFLEELQSLVDRVSFWQSPYILKTFGICMRGSFQLVTEYMQDRSMLNLFKTKYPFKLHHRVSAAENIAQALMYLEELDCVHGSVRSMNILVNECENDKIVVKLAHPNLLGVSDKIKMEHRQRILAERFPWKDPLTYDKFAPVTPQSDIFSFGVTMWEIMSNGVYPLGEFRGNMDEVKKFYLGGSQLSMPNVLKPSDTDSEVLADNKKKLARLIRRAMTLSDDRISARDLVRDLRQMLSTIDPLAYDTLCINDSAAETLDSFVNIDFAQKSPALVDEEETKLVRPKPMNTTTGTGSRPLPAVPGDRFVIPEDKMVIDFKKKSLGHGYYGEVRQAQWTDHNGVQQDCAVKFLKPEHMDRWHEEMRKEIIIMSNLNHQNIVCILGECPFRAHGLGLVMELVKWGSLKTYLLLKRDALIRKLLPWSIEIAEGMKYLSEIAKPPVVHRDLAARNVLITANETAKISDFGLAKMLKDKDYYRSTNGKMPVLWCPPEAFDSKFSAKSDVWSYGVTLWEIYSYGEKPNSEKLQGGKPINMPQNQPDFGEVDKFYVRVQAGARLKKPNNSVCYEEIYKLMQQCWQDKAEDRPVFSTIVDLLVYFQDSLDCI